VARRATAAFVALAAADTFLAATGRHRQRWLTKPLLMPALMVGRDRPAQRALALGGLSSAPLRSARQVLAHQRSRFVLIFITAALG
jgi:hypothetical protein